MARKKITARIAANPELLRRFHEQFPGHGSLSWLLEQAIRECLAITDGQPPLADIVRGAIRSSILRERLINRDQIAKRPSDPDSIKLERLDASPNPASILRADRTTHR